MTTTVRARQPSAANALALLYALGGLGCLLGAAFPMSPHAPVGLGQLLGPTGLVISAALLVWRARVDTAVLNGALVVNTALVSLLVACSKTAAGVTITGLNYLCIALIAAYFLPRWMARAHAALAVCGFTSGVAAGGVPAVTAFWLVVVATVVAASETLAHLVRQLRQLAATDPLTGLANRATFRASAEREIALALRGERPFTLALLDLDDFKTVNDTRGHAAGDALLAELTAAWRGRLRRGDLLARLGGDEFVLVMPRTARDDAVRVLDRLRDAYPAEWSAGVVSRDDDTALDALLKRADNELYEEKRRRKNVASTGEGRPRVRS
jgi:diguanylate cyclase (GGDEF)-like protein